VSRRKRPENEPLAPTYFTAWRKHKKFTLRQLAKIMDITPTAISRLERGISPYDQIHLQQMSRIFGVTITDLLEKDPLRPKATAVLVDLVKKLERPADISAVKMFVEAILSRR
jgi:transcriptional regulator with XRE-family HTH domain